MDFYYKLHVYRIHDIDVVFSCEDYEDVEMRIMNMLPNILMSEVDIEKLLALLYEEDEGDEDIC